MFTDTRRTLSLALGLLAALVIGSPAWADDTELLLLNPNPGVTPQPNILFIFDSSGSMSAEETTKEIYDSSKDYGGPCEDDELYWTDVDTVPSCGGSNKKTIDKSAFMCADAKRQVGGIGVYTAIMAQFRNSGGGTPMRWDTLEPDNDDDLVECKDDRGQHGGGTAGEVFATKGSDVAPFTSNIAQEIAWGSWPTSQTVTVYDGNYLNYRISAPNVTLSRNAIVRAVAKAVLSAIEDVNVGIMRFNLVDGGPVIQSIVDLDTNRASIDAAVDAIPAGGWTPLSETLYESALYWRGMPAWYGENINETATDPGALASNNPEIYQQPATEVCAKNYNILMTDGVPTEDQDTPGLVDGLPNWAAVTGQAGCLGSGDGHCLDEISKYLFLEDISTDPGAQFVTTHTIGFAIDLPILADTAAASEGTYFLADDVESLSLALLTIVNNINERSLSFTAPAVAVNTFNRTQNLNDLFLTTFGARPNIHWPGNLKKYRVFDGGIVDADGADAVNPLTGFFFETARSYWSAGIDGNDVTAGGAASNLPDPSTRKLYTESAGNFNLLAGVNAVSVSNSGAFTDAELGLTGSAGEPTKDQLIDWARGVDIKDEDLDPATTVRNIMGDPLHSQPAAIVYGGTPTNPEIVVYTATNDGYLHAIDADTGQELWAYIPRELLENLTPLYFDPASTAKQYGVDGDIVSVTKDVNNDGTIQSGDGDFVYLIFGMRRGGQAYYALDVTNKTSPKLLWRKSAAQFGQTWSAPAVARIDINDPGLNADKAVVVIGGGYDPVHDTITQPASSTDGAGAGIHFLDLQTGATLWRAAHKSDSTADLKLDKLTRAIPTAVQVIDMSGDGLADRMYAADMGGQILRFDITNGNAPGSLVAGGVIAQLGAEGNSVGDPDTRRFYAAPDVSVFNDNAQNRRFVALSIGSGYRSHPLDNTNNDRFYSIRDKNVFSQLTQAEYDAFPIIRESDLQEISGTVETQIGASQAGWKFTLPFNQKVLSSSVTFDNEIFFVAFSPDNAAAATCAAGVGRNFLYRVTVNNGDPIADLDNLIPGTEDDARVSELQQGGIAPSPRFLFPSPDDPDNCTGEECNPPPLGCIGVECFDPGFTNSPIRTLWTQDGIE